MQSVLRFSSKKGYISFDRAAIKIEKKMFDHKEKSEYL